MPIVSGVTLSDRAGHCARRIFISHDEANALRHDVARAGRMAGACRQILAATISRTTSAKRIAQNERSRTTACRLPTMADVATAIRPTNHAVTKTTSGVPLTGVRPVQFGIAVNTKPPRAAAAAPNNISCACQRVGAKDVVSVASPRRIESQIATAIAAPRPAPKKSGLNP